jgi:PAN domain
MKTIAHRIFRATLFAAALAGVSTSTGAQTSAPLSAKGARIVKMTGVWVEGPGATITYGGTYTACADQCLANPSCLMLEYYRPEKKCNLYREVRPRLKGGSSDVGLRQLDVPPQ